MGWMLTRTKMLSLLLITLDIFTCKCLLNFLRGLLNVMQVLKIRISFTKTFDRYEIVSFVCQNDWLMVFGHAQYVYVCLIHW